jgi:hypothetical protein
MRAVAISIVLALGCSSLARAAEPAAGARDRPAAQPDASTDLSGTYWATEYHPRLLPIGGGEPPLNDAGKAAYATNRTGLKDGSLDDPTSTYCLPEGIPRLLSTPYPFQLYQLPPGQVTFVHELNNQVRVVPLGRSLPSYEETVVNPTYEGYASGRYDGAVLVIRGNGFNDQTFLDASGLPHSDRLETTERVRRIGNQLENIVTIHDPEYYSRDWQARFVYERRPGLRLQEHVCGEPHRDISHVKGIPEIRAARAKGLFP